MKKETKQQNIADTQMGYDTVLATVLDVIKEIPQQGQVQYDLQRQLRELRFAANKLGLYDAADFLRPHCG